MLLWYPGTPQLPGDRSQPPFIFTINKLFKKNISHKRIMNQLNNSRIKKTLTSGQLGSTVALNRGSRSQWPLHVEIVYLALFKRS